MKAGSMRNSDVQRKWRQQHLQFKKKCKGIEDLIKCDLVFLNKI